MLKHRINYILPGEAWKIEFEDIPCLDVCEVNLNNLIHKKAEPLLGGTGMNKETIIQALKNGEIHDVLLTEEQIYFLNSLI